MDAINIRLVLRAPTLTLPRYAGEGICFPPITARHRDRSPPRLDGPCPRAAGEGQDGGATARDNPWLVARKERSVFREMIICRTPEYVSLLPGYKTDAVIPANAGIPLLLQASEFPHAQN